MAVLDDHNPIVVMAMPAAIVMHFCTRVGAVVMSDHDVFGTCDRRRCDSNRSKRGNNVSKLLHIVLLVLTRNQHRVAGNVPHETAENSERVFIERRYSMIA
jgi:hypothetical protein